MTNKIRILLADDHEIVRRGLRALLEDHPQWEIVEEAANGKDAVEKAFRIRPEIVVMDINMPELNGLEATRQIVRGLAGTQVLVLSMHESEALVREVLTSGARGYVLKSDAGRDLVAAIEALSGNRPFFTSRVSEMLLDSYLSGSAPAGLPAPEASPRITAREREVLQLLAEGKSNKEVGHLLQISVKTVETHRARIMDKLNLASFSELVRYAIRNKFIES